MTKRKAFFIVLDENEYEITLTICFILAMAIPAVIAIAGVLKTGDMNLLMCAAMCLVMILLAIKIDGSWIYHKIKKMLEKN